MRRHCVNYLIEWLSSLNRKPLIIRGARQVGKTWSVREAATLGKKKLIELNFEKDPALKSLFHSNDPAVILRHIETHFHIDIHREKTLLFLDEIQVVPELLSKLRWFAEEAPEIAVVAAGSLLDFVLDKHEFSMPVGRITYLYIEPLSFEEFLLAQDLSKLIDFIQQTPLQESIPDSIHEQLITQFKTYTIIGGMPAAVAAWISNASLKQVSRIHHDLLTTYRDDFAKYAGKINIEHLEETLSAIPKLLGSKFRYSHVNPNAPTTPLKSALDLLCKARICHKVVSSAGNGIPLAAESNKKFFKVILLDTGLASSLLGLNLNDIHQANDINLINKGAIAEQIVGQQLRCQFPEYISPTLHYWQRHEKSANAELDYLIQQGTQVVPIEVKSGQTGTLKSLHLFMHLKKLNSAIRINMNKPLITNLNTKLHDGSTVHYQLTSLPFYMISRIQS